MIGWRVAVLMLAVCLGAIVLSGVAAADPGTHQVDVTDGNGGVNASYQYDAATGNVTATYDWGSEEVSLGSPDESSLAIQWAIDNSTATYSEIRIGPGTYNGTVNVTANDRTISAASGLPGTNLTAHPDSGQNGINVNASNVLIENVTVHSAPDSGIVIRSDSENVSLKGISVIDSDRYGVRLLPPTTNGFHSITDSTFTENGYWAISALRVHENEIINNTVTDSVLGIELSSSFRNSVENNRIHHNSGGSFTGIFLNGGSEDNDIASNVIQHNSGTGIQVGSDTDTVGSTTLRGNRIENVSGTGVHVEGNGTTLDGTVINGSGEEGIHLEGFENQTIRNVTVRNSTGRAIQVNGTANVEIDGVSVLGGTIEGIRVNESSSSVRVVNSTILRTGYRGVEMRGSGGDDGYIVRNNTFSGTDSTAIYIYNTDGTVIDTNSVVDGYSRAIRIHLVNDARIVNNSIRNNTYSLFTAIRVDVNSDNATVAGNSIVDNLGNSIVVGNWNIPSTGHTIADNYVHNASIRGIVNYGNDTTISGNEVSEIDGTAVELFQVSNVTVRDGSTSRSEFGVHVNRSVDIELVNHSSTENNKTGVWFEESADATVKDVTVNRNGNHGIWIASNSDRAIVDNSTGLNNGGVGVSFDHSQNGSIQNTVADGNQYGIQLSNESVGTTVEMVDLTNNDVGFHAINASETTLRASRATDNDFSGIYVDLSPNSTLRNNTVLDNNGAGSLPQAGISIENSSDVVVDDNVVRRNRLAGVYIQFADRTRVTDNRVTENSGGKFGMSIAETADVYVAGNNVSNNTGDGLQIFSNSPDATLVDTRVNDNAGWGIAGSSNTTMENLTATGNANWGITVGDDSVVRNSTVRDNGGEGFFVSGNDVTITDSETINNSAEEVYVQSMVSGLTATNFVIGTLPYDIADAHDVSFNESDGSGPAAPGDFETVGPAVNMSAGAGGYANLSVHYTGTQADGVDEPTIGLHRYNDSSSTWDAVTGSTVDAGSNTVSANVTSFSTFRMLGEAASGGGGPVFIPAPPSGDTTPSADFTVTDVTIDASEVGVGESVTVSVRVENDGDAHGTFTGNLSVDGQMFDTGSVQVNKNYHATLEFSTSFGQPGTYQLAVDEHQAGTVEVTGVAAFSVSDVSLDSTSVEPGDTVTITATVSNDDSAEDTGQVPLVIGGQQVDSRSVTLGPGESTAVTFEHTFDTSGSQSVSVGGREIGTVDVAESDSESSSGDGGRLGPVLLVIVGVVLVGGGTGVYFREEIRETIEEGRK